MLSAKLTNKQRKAVYKRDDFMCALCGSNRGIQIHHVVPGVEVEQHIVEYLADIYCEDFSPDWLVHKTALLAMVAFYMCSYPLHVSRSTHLIVRG